MRVSRPQYQPTTNEPNMMSWSSCQSYVDPMSLMFNEEPVAQTNFSFPVGERVINNIGKIIGRNGKHLKTICKYTGCDSIHFDAVDAMFYITGPVESRGIAFTLLTRHIDTQLKRRW